MKRASRKANRWADHYTRKAKADNYPARSVYKLQEIQRRHAVIAKGNRVLDLGCAPGSWLLYAAEIVGPGGRVVGVDLKPVKSPLPSHVSVYTADLLDLAPEVAQDLGRGFDVVLSDMAPATTGSAQADSARSYYLALAALDVARTHLAANGGFVCKIFQGEDEPAFAEAVRTVFRQVKRFKPQSSRKASREIFVVAKGKR